MARLERIVERLELKEFQLRTLLDVSKAINNTQDRGELLVIYERAIRVELGITRLALFERIDRWERILSFGTPDNIAVSEAEKVFASINDIQVINAEHEGILSAFDVAVPVQHQGRPIAFLLLGDIEEEAQTMSPVVRHLNFIQTLTNLVVVALDNRRRAQEQAQRDRDKRELELAAQMQQLLVPQELPSAPTLQAAGWYQPHQLVGGDYYDLLSLGDDRYLACVADVSGKGIAAALLMSNFQAVLRSHAANVDDLEAVVRELNARVFASARGERFITLFIALIDMRARTMRYVNAGHNDPLLHDGRRSVPLHDGAIALGMMPTLPFLRSGSIELPKDATLFCYTDGLVEQEDAHGSAFGTERIESALNDLTHVEPASIVSNVITKLETHRGAEPYLDDIALLVCRFKG